MARGGAVPFELADGRLAIDLSLGYRMRNGKRTRYRKRLTQRAGETAKAFGIRVRSEQVASDRGLPLTDDRTTVAGFLERWYEATAPGLRPKSRRHVRNIIDHHLVPELGHLMLWKLDPAAVQVMVNRKAGSGLSPQMVHHCRGVLRNALNQAVAWGAVPRNVATLSIKMPKLTRPDIHPLTPEQGARLLEACESHRLGALFATCLLTGMRQGEALGLRWTNVRTTDVQPAITIREQLQRVKDADGTGLRLVDVKSKASRRALTLPPQLVVILEAHRTRQKRERLLAGSRWVESGYVFTTSIGTPLENRKAWGELRALLATCGCGHAAHASEECRCGCAEYAAILPAIRFHDLRHSFATWALARGFSATDVAAQLGHSSPALVWSTYAHVLPETRRQVGSAVADLLSEAR